MCEWAVSGCIEASNECVSQVPLVRAGHDEFRPDPMCANGHRPAVRTTQHRVGSAALAWWDTVKRCAHAFAFTPMTMHLTIGNRGTCVCEV